MRGLRSAQPRRDAAFAIQRGQARYDAARLPAALRLARRAVALDPCATAAYILLGGCHQALNALGDACDSLDRAIAIAPNDAVPRHRRARLLLELGRSKEALADALRATALDRDDVVAWTTLGRIFGKLGQYPLAFNAYARALSLDPNHPFLKGRILQQQVLACDWRGIDALIADIERDLTAGQPSARPFVWQAVATSAESLQRCAALFARAPVTSTMPPVPRSGGRIRIGYLSGELREHSISFLRAGMFEHHDKNRFEIVAFDNGWDDSSAVRARINAAMNRIVPVRDLGDADAAAQITAAGIDVLVDLNGFNGRNRIGIMARRPAPVQATFPGYPGTLGARYIDYIIADAIVVPPEHRRFYAEKAALLPDCYQANDRNKAIAKRRFARGDLGLPERGFVFCCFNNTYKIMPATFAAWMRILHAVPGSVLWLLAGNAYAMVNLGAAATQHGIDPARLVFAARIPLAEHLARHRAADLFLDTLPCNAHTTASDALWAGLPVLTCLGATFSGRVAASVLHAIRLPELVMPSLAAYEAAAIRLATVPDELAALRARLATNRLTTPLFDTARHTRHIEQAYVTMHARHVAGLPPAEIVVPAL